MNSFIARMVLVAVACCVVFAVAVGPAAAVSGPVPNHAMVGTVDLYGMSDVDARATIVREAALPALAPLGVSVAGRSWALDAAQFVSLDVDAMLAQAYAPSAEPTVTVLRRCSVSAPAIDACLVTIAAAVKSPAANASYYLDRGRLLWRPAVFGTVLQSAAAKAALTEAFMAEGLSGAAQPVVTLQVAQVAPRITDDKLGRAITVDISSRKLRLFDHSTKLREYGVAVGMRGYSTPKGTWKVIGKRMNPSWGNPGSGWASSMPSSIRPGYYNPLGTRALYLNAPGIRIHGTSKTRSIGRAASHGCVRVANRNIEKLYPLVPIGTPVFIVQ